MTSITFAVTIRVICVHVAGVGKTVVAATASASDRHYDDLYVV